MPQLQTCRRWARRLMAAAGLAASATPSAAQDVASNQRVCPPPPCYTVPGTVMPSWPPGTSTPQSTPQGTPQTSPQAPPGITAPPTVDPVGSGQALSGSMVATAQPGGYVDFAIPVSQFRLRYDSAYGNNRPDRAEFFYPKCGCFGTPDAKGPPLVESNVDYQELRPYFEYAFGCRFSAFIETPVRFVNPEQNANEAGFSNLVAGFKYAAVAQPNQFVTFQFLTTTPTADGFRGLGNELTAVEPGVLWYRQLGERLALHAEVRDWIPIGGSDFAGNILRTGAAVTYLWHNGCNFRVTPIGEVVGWTVLSGKELAVANVGVGPTQAGAVVAEQDASGDCIVNAKIGVRFGFGPTVGPANLSRQDLYIGYGRALTGDVWYQDMFRVEYGLRF